MDNMQDILKNYYAAGGKELFESRENLDEAPYLDKNYIPVNIDDVITSIHLPPDVKNWNDKLNMKIWNDRPSFPKDSGTVRIDPYKIQKLTKGATPVVKLDDGYYTFRSEDDKTVHIQKIESDIDGNYGKRDYGYDEDPTIQSMSMDDFINKARGSDDNISEAPIYPRDTYYVSKAELLKVIDSNYNIDHNKLMQLTDRQKPIVKVIKPIEQPVNHKITGIWQRLNKPFRLPIPTKKVLNPGVYKLNQDKDGIVNFYGKDADIDILDKDGKHVDLSDFPDSNRLYRYLDNYDHGYMYMRHIPIHLKDLINYIE